MFSLFFANIYFVLSKHNINNLCIIINYDKIQNTKFYIFQEMKSL